MKMHYLIAVAALLLHACSDQSQSASEPSATTVAANVGTVGTTAVAMPAKRWYEFSQVARGARVFAANCAECHGKGGEGDPNWRQVGADGRYPPPPLNGTGHAWHHPLKMLFYVVKRGSPGGQGNMPAWAGKLSDEDIIAAIAWFQSRWPDRIYAAWVERDQQRNGG